MDERESQNAGQASLAILGIGVLALLGWMTWTWFRHERVETWAVVTLLGVSGLFWLLEQLGGGLRGPRNVLGQELPTGPEGRGERLRAYALDAGIFAAGITVLTGIGMAVTSGWLQDMAWTGLSGAPLVITTLALEFIGTGGIAFLLIMLTGEGASRIIERRYAEQ